MLEKENRNKTSHEKNKCKEKADSNLNLEYDQMIKYLEKINYK